MVVTVNNLRAEHRSDPSAIGTPSPRCRGSWSTTVTTSSSERTRSSPAIPTTSLRSASSGRPTPCSSRGLRSAPSRSSPPRSGSWVRMADTPTGAIRSTSRSACSIPRTGRRCRYGHIRGCRRRATDPGSAGGSPSGRACAGSAVRLGARRLHRACNGSGSATTSWPGLDAYRHRLRYQTVDVTERCRSATTCR